MSNEGRSIGGRKDGPAFPGSRERTCAEYVRLMASRYLRGIATLDEFRSAVASVSADLNKEAKGLGGCAPLMGDAAATVEESGA